MFANLLVAAALSMPTADAGKLSPIATLDSDGDGVIDLLDVCSGSDDTVDIDANGTPDCSETFVTGAAFDNSSDVTNWSVNGGSTVTYAPVYMTDDGNNYSPSGSARIQTNFGAPEYAVTGCIAVSPATNHVVGMQHRLSSFDPQPGTVLRVWEFTSSSKCATNKSADAKQASYTAYNGSDTVFIDMVDTFTTRPDTYWVRVAISVHRDDVTGMGNPAFLAYDNVLLHDNVKQGEGDDDGGTSISFD